MKSKVIFTAILGLRLGLSVLEQASAETACLGERHAQFRLLGQDSRGRFLMEMKSQFLKDGQLVAPVDSVTFAEPNFAVIRRLVASQLYSKILSGEEKANMGQALIPAMAGELAWLRAHRNLVLANRVMLDKNFPSPAAGYEAVFSHVDTHGPVIDKAFKDMEDAIRRARADPKKIVEIHLDYMKSEKEVRMGHNYERTDRRGSITQTEILVECRPVVSLTGIEHLLAPVRKSRLDDDPAIPHR